ncbi:MAG: hypothetical protein ACRDPY_31665 [Streptosporangiaceae bacterium]
MDDVFVAIDHRYEFDYGFASRWLSMPVTNQVTTAAGNGRRNATYPDSGIALARGDWTL